MSDSQAYDPVLVSSDGVTVAKRFEADEFPVPAIAFRITSERSETVSVRLVDSVPEDVAVEDLGFHPEYGSEYWTIDDQQITFERDIEAGSEYTTVYGIRSTGTDNVEQFLTQPTIEMVDPPLEDDDGDVLDESSSDVVKDVIAGESNSVPGLDDEDDEEIETLNLKDPTAPEEEQATGGGDGAEAEVEPEGGEGEAEAEAQPAGSTNVTRTLLAEIKRGEVDDQILAALRKTLSNGTGGDAAKGGALDARIQHLQNEVSDLTAYTQSLEEFLAENGTGQQMIEEFQDQLDDFQNELDQMQSMAVENSESMERVESRVSEVDDRIDSVEGTVGSLDDSVGSLESEVDSIGNEVRELNEETDELGGEIDSIGNEVRELNGQVDEVGTEVDEVGGTVGDLEENLSSLEGEVQGLREDLEDVRNSVGDVENVDEQIREIEEEIRELKEWREQLSSVIGG